MIPRLFLAIAFSGFCLVFHLQGAEPNPGLTLDRAIQIALDKHPGMAEADAEIRAAQAREGRAGLPDNPELIARMESAPMAAGTTSRAEYVAGISQSVPLGNRLAAAKQVSTSELQASRLSRASEAWRIKEDVHNAFATALYAEEILTVQTNLATSASEFLRITQARVDQGDLAPFELSRAAADQSQARLQLGEAERIHQKTLRALTLAMGAPVAEFQSLQGKLEDVFNLVAVQQWLTNRSDHPEILLSQSLADTEAARLRLARAERIPDLNFDLLYRRLQAEKADAFDVGVSIAIPIFDRKSKVREAAGKMDAAQARAERTRLEVRHDREQHELTLLHEHEIATRLREDVIPKIAETLQSAEARYKAGDLPLNELILLRREMAQGRLQYLESLRRLMTAWSALNI